MRKPHGSGSAPRRSPPRRPPRLFPRPRCTSPLRPPVCARWAFPKKSSAHSPLSSSPALPVTRAVRGVSETSVPTRPRTGSGAWAAPSRTFSSRSSRRRERSTRLHRRCAASRGTRRLRRSLASIRRISVESSRSALPTASASPPSIGQCVRTLRGNKPGYGNLVAIGEFLLGYPNEYDRYTERPLVDPGGAADLLPPAAEDSSRRDVGRNGTLSRASRSATGRSRILVVRAIRRTRERFRRTAAQRRSSRAGGGGSDRGHNKNVARRAREQLYLRGRSAGSLMSVRRSHPPRESAHRRFSHRALRTDRYRRRDAGVR